jgi:hypothetical protein
MLLMFVVIVVICPAIIVSCAMSASNGVAIGCDSGEGGGCDVCGGGLSCDGPGVGVGGVSGQPRSPTHGDLNKAASSPKNPLPDNSSSVSESARNGSSILNNCDDQVSGGCSGDGNREEGTTSSPGVVMSCGCGTGLECDGARPHPRSLCPR